MENELIVYESLHCQHLEFAESTKVSDTYDSIIKLGASYILIFKTKVYIVRHLKIGRDSRNFN